MENEARINVLEKRVDRMETTVQEVCQKTSAIDAILNRLEVTQSRLVDALEHFGSINEEFKLTLRDIQYELKNNTESTNGVKIKITEIEKKFEEAENKSKIDWRIIVRDGLSKSIPWIISLILALVYLADKLAKEFIK